MSEKRWPGLGWRRDLPDYRDHHPETDTVKAVLEASKPLRKATVGPPTKVDLRKYCSPVEDQASLGSCTANAGVGLMEYFQRRAFGTHLDGSRLFLYKATRNLLGWIGDQGAYLRTTMQAMVLFGITPESYWPYQIADYDTEPTSFAYAFAQNYRAVAYYRLDNLGVAPADLVKRCQQFLAAGLPFMFGFSVYSSIPGVGDGNADIPFPRPGDRFLGGHAVMAVGYESNREIDGEKGAFIIRNSWGTNWGEGGYGYLPFKYFEQQLAVDCWSLSDANFVNTGLFE